LLQIKAYQVNQANRQVSISNYSIAFRSLLRGRLP